MSKLKISDDLSLPLDFTTQTQAILAKRGVGKTYTASVEAEELLKAKQQVVVIDPTGAWWGLKSSADGKSEGFPIAVLGGEHADVPLDEHAGEVIATAIVERRFSAILDLSLFRKGQLQRFMSPFLETLYRLNREAMHLFVDESDAIAPQKPFGDEARTLGAMEDVVRRGRKRGIGCTLVTQRPAVLNKNVLTQCEILCAMRLLHPKDIDAIEEWVNVHADPQQAKAMIESLPSLPVGSAWFWSPGWGDIFQRVQVRRRETFDSSATPKAGEKAREPKVLAPVDIEKLGAEIQSTVEKQKANDPAALRKQIAELQKQLAQRPKQQVEKTIEKVVEVPVLKNGQLTRTEKHAERLEAIAVKLLGESQELRRLIAPAAAPRPILPVHSGPLGAAPITIPLSARAAMDRTPSPAPRPKSAPVAAPSGELTNGEQRILDIVRMLGTRGIVADRDSVARWMAIHPNGGRYGRELARLRADGYLDGFALTALGNQTARNIQTGIDAAKTALPDGTKLRILQTIVDAAEPISREELAERLGIHPNGGRYGRDLAWLRTMGVITNRGAIAPTEGLFR